MDVDKLQNILDTVIDNKKIWGTSFSVSYKGNTWSGTSGNFAENDQFFIASTTKLYTTTVILNLEFENNINIDDSISKYLSNDIIDGLHILDGIEYSDTITIRNLLAHTSGLPDYFQQPIEKNNSLLDLISKNTDISWTFEQVIDWTKNMKPKFVPNKKGSAYYSDTNFQLLGKIIETVTGKSLEANYEKYIYTPLQLKNTYLYSDILDKNPKNLFFKQQELHIPKAMASFGPDGGIISTSQELLEFLIAFSTGKLFPKGQLDSLQVWNPVFFPIESGIGIHRLKLPWIFNPFGKIPTLIGHSGLSGTFAYGNTEADLYIAGTVNQVAYPEKSFKLAISLIQKILNSKE